MMELMDKPGTLWFAFWKPPRGMVRHSMWVAHCLDLDVVTQGKSFRHACAMINEAVGIALEYGDTMERAAMDRSAPGPEWRSAMLCVASAVEIGTLPSGRCWVVPAGVKVTCPRVVCESQSGNALDLSGVRL